MTQSPTLPDRALCVACDRRQPSPGLLTCKECAARLDGLLVEIDYLYRQLDPRPRTGGGRGGRGAPGFGSRSPANDHIIALTDPRTRRLDPDRPGTSAIVNVVGWWADLGREVRAIPERTRPRTVAGEVDAIRRRLTWFLRHYEVEAMVAELRGCSDVLLAAVGQAEPTIPLGSCPVPTGQPPGWYRCVSCHQLGESDPVLGPVWCDECADLAPIEPAPGPTCARAVRARVWGETARCSAGHRWETLDELRQLAGQLGGAHMDVPGLARWFGMPESTVRTWANRDHWHPAGGQARGTRRLYDLADALWSWVKRHAVEPTPVDELAS